MTREERALKIAEFEGKTNCVELSPLEQRFIQHGDYIMPDDYNKLHYSSFNGLMPIVERVNKSESAPMYFNFAKRFVTLRKKFFDKNKIRFHCKNTPLIDALQEAIIYYHENKEQN